MPDVFIVLASYGVTRLISAIFVVVAGRNQQGTAQFVSDDPWSYYVWDVLPGAPGYADVLSNWDGQWYLRIATLGYVPSSDDALGFAERAWAFPPVYPLTVKLAGALAPFDAAVTATLVSTVAGAVAMVLLFRLGVPRLGRFGAHALVLVTSCYVTAVLYQAAYAESMALCFLLWTLLDLRGRRYVRMFVPLLLLSLTRLVTPPLAVVAVAHLLHRRRTGDLSHRESLLLVTYATAAVVGAMLWPRLAAVLDGTTGVDRARAMTSAEHLGWFDILWSLQPWTVLVPVVLSAWFIRVARSERDRLGPELAAWGASYPVFVLLVTPPTPGFLRYFMLAFPLGVGAVGSLDSPVRRRATGVALVCVATLVLQYLWIRYSFVIDPSPDRPVLNP